MDLKFPDRPFRIHGGAKIDHRKNTNGKKSRTMIPRKVELSMLQHIGAACEVNVKKGDIVKIGDVVGKSVSYVSAPVHASVSGKVSDIKDLQLPNNINVKSVVIESDGEMKLSSSISPPVVNDLKSFLDAVRESGLVGLGGAGFPTHVKLNVPQGKNVDTLIINVAECEPYITVDHEESLENTEDILFGIQKVIKYLNIPRCIIAVEDNKMDVVRKIEGLLSDSRFELQGKVKVLKIKSKYPGGAEKVLVKYCTGREISAGKLPMDVGCIIMNVTTVSFLYRYLKTGIPLVSKRVTVDGSAIKNPQNVIVPIGTPIRDIIKFCDGYKTDPGKILMGGPMMGLSIIDDNLPILKQNNAIIVLNVEDATLPSISDCIRCGRCVDGCPMNLLPTMIEKAVIRRDIDRLKKYGIMSCMECGCCAYNCPAGRQLVQSIRVGKKMLKDSEKR